MFIVGTILPKGDDDDRFDQCSKLWHFFFWMLIIYNGHISIVHYFHSFMYAWMAIWVVLFYTISNLNRIVPSNPLLDPIPNLYNNKLSIILTKQIITKSMIIRNNVIILQMRIDLWERIIWIGLIKWILVAIQLNYKMINSNN